jgi:ApbE superfamily uncharacterized protein (UPF0280 family)
MGEYYTTEFHLEQTHMVLKSDISDSFSAARRAVIHSRALLERYIQTHPNFVTSIEPIDLNLSAPEFVRNMMHAGLAADVGPMAAVAGGLSEMATTAMMKHKCKLALADNGGDISIKGNSELTVGVHAGEGSVAKQVGFKIKAVDLPMGICTSSGVFGHSISFGEADAVVIFSKSAFLSDAAATAVANKVKKADPEGTIQNAIEIAENIDDVKGCMIFIGELVGSSGWVPEMVQIIE